MRSVPSLWLAPARPSLPHHSGTGLESYKSGIVENTRHKNKYRPGAGVEHEARDAHSKSSVALPRLLT